MLHTISKLTCRAQINAVVCLQAIISLKTKCTEKYIEIENFPL